MSRVFWYFWASIDHKTQTNPVSVIAETPALIRILPIWPLTYCLSWPGSSGALPGTPAILRRLQSVLWNYKLLKMHSKAVWLDFSPSQFRVSSFLISCFGWFPHTRTPTTLTTQTPSSPPPETWSHRTLCCGWWSTSIWRSSASLSLPVCSISLPRSFSSLHPSVRRCGSEFWGLSSLSEVI